MAHYTYLLLNFFTLLIPFALSFESKVSFYRKWKFYLPSLLITAILFLVWDFFKTKYGVWQFNENYIIGIKFYGLPLEEYLFFFTVPYACTFIYEVLAYYIKITFFPKFSKSLLAFAGVVFLTFSFSVFPLAYTWSVTFGMACVIPFLLYALPIFRLQLFLIMYLISLLPMFIVNGVLTAMPVVIYNNAYNIGIRAFSIPVEDFLYSFIMLGLNIGLYELFKSIQPLRNNLSFIQAPIHS